MRNDKCHHRSGYCCGMPGMQKESFNMSLKEWEGNKVWVV